MMIELRLRYSIFDAWWWLSHGPSVIWKWPHLKGLSVACKMSRKPEALPTQNTWTWSVCVHCSQLCSSLQFNLGRTLQHKPSDAESYNNFLSTLPNLTLPPLPPWLDLLSPLPTSCHLWLPSTLNALSQPAQDPICWAFSSRPQI